MSAPKIVPVDCNQTTSSRKSGDLRAQSIWRLSTISKITPLAFSLADQGFAVSGAFVGNIVLARAQTKDEYGLFALSYSVFTFLSALHNSTVLEPFTVYGAGRYRERFPQYLRLMFRINIFVGLFLAALVLLAYFGMHIFVPRFASRSFLGLAAAVGILLSGAFLRRTFYLQRRPDLAAKASFVCFLTIACALWLATKIQIINGLSLFVILSLGWIVAGLTLRSRITRDDTNVEFLVSEPEYWRIHWKYSKWVLATAFVFQLATQGYYWILAGFISVREVAELRVTYLLISPVEQVFIALALLAIPELANCYATRQTSRLVVVLRRYWIALFLIAVAFGFLVRICGARAIHFLYGGKFDDLVPMLYMLALLPLAMTVSNAFSCALNASERPRIVFYGYLCSGGATFLGGIPLVMRFGLRGAVYGMLFSGVVFAVAVTIGFFLARRNAKRVSLPLDQHSCMGRDAMVSSEEIG